MSTTFVQLLFAGLTVGAVYALIALGFSLVYNASHLINFAQGEFVMLGGLAAAFMVADGIPPGIAAVLTVLLAVAVALTLYALGIRPARGAGVVALIIVTIGASILIRGLAGIVFDRNFHSLPPISGDEPVMIMGAPVASQSLWVMGVTAVVAVLLGLFFTRTLWGKAMLAAAWNPLAAELVGIDPRKVVLASFALAGALGALAGLLITPLAPTHFQVGTMLGLKGFAAAIVGGLGSGPGALVGGLVVGLTEAFAAGYLSSAYKDAIAFVIILGALVLRPQGLLGRAPVERV